MQKKMIKKMMLILYELYIYIYKNYRVINYKKEVSEKESHFYNSI